MNFTRVQSKNFLVQGVPDLRYTLLLDCTLGKGGI